MLVLILFVIAAICFALAAFGSSSPKVNLTALGLACLAVAFAVQAYR